MIPRFRLLTLPLVVAVLALSALGVCHAQSGSFIIPTIRANGGTDFAYWDLFRRPPGSSTSANFNFPNPPALIDGRGEDDDGNPTTAFASRTVLRQTGTPTAFITSSGAIYSFSDPLAVVVPYMAPAELTGEVTNVIFQSMTGGARLNVNSVFLRYQDSGGQTVDLLPVFRALDDPQTGAFSERIISAFQWNLTGLNLRQFTIVFDGPTSMPLWEAQLDAVVGTPFVQELGYLLSTRVRPGVRFGRPGRIDTNLPLSADGRFFLADEVLNLTGEPEPGWQATGWFYDGEVTSGGNLPLVFPARDILVTALFAPLSYADWRELSFFRFNGLLGTANDHTNDAVSAALVDHDADGLNNAGEYAFAGNPYAADVARTQPQMVMVDVAGVPHPAIRYRGNGLPVGAGDVVQTAQISTQSGIWTDNGQQAVAVEVARELQPDGSVLVTERTQQPLSAFTQLSMRVAWSVGGVAGAPQMPVVLAAVTAPSLTMAEQGRSYLTELQAAGGLAPYVWSLEDGSLPLGVTLATDGRLQGVPQGSGSFGFTLKVEDALGAEATRAFTLEVAPFGINTAADLGSVPVQNAFERQLAVVGGTAPHQWTLVGGALPTGLSLSSGGELSGVPTVPGLASFRLRVEDANGLSNERDFSLIVVDLRFLTPVSLPIAVLNRAYQNQFEVTGGRAPFVWSLQGGTLPLGLELSASGLLQGTPLQSGGAEIDVWVEDADGYQLTGRFQVMVSPTLLAPVLAPVAFPDTQIGAVFAQQVVAANYPDRYLITGLPRGLVWNARTGSISGRAALAGFFMVQIQAVNQAGSSAMQTVPLRVRALPSSLTGSFTAWSTRGAVNGSLGSAISLRTTVNGSYTVAVRTGAVTRSARGFLNTAAPQVQVEVSGGLLALTIDPQTGAITGTHGGAVVSGWRAVWDRVMNPASGREGYYSVALELDAGHASVASLPKGVGFATFTVPANGILRIAGRTADGQPVVSSGPLGPNGEIAVYAPQHGNKGSVIGQWELAEDAAGLFADNEITGTLSWQKPETKGRVYAAAFGPVTVNASGSYLAQSARGQTVLGLPDLGEFALEFSEGGIGESATVADVSGINWTERFLAVMPSTGNAAQVSVRIHRSTGVMSGAFSLTEMTPPLVRRNVSFFGQVVRTADDEVKAVGYFLLPQIPTAGQRPNATPILSGAVFAVQPTL